MTNAIGGKNKNTVDETVRTDIPPFLQEVHTMYPYFEQLAGCPESASACRRWTEPAPQRAKNWERA